MNRDFPRAIFYPGYDTSRLSDEELQIKTHEISRRIAAASGVFVNQEIVNQLYNLQNILLTEQDERIEKERYALIEAARPKFIETEPDLRERDIRKDTPIKRDETRKRLHVPQIIKSWKALSNPRPESEPTADLKGWKLPPETKET